MWGGCGAPPPLFFCSLSLPLLTNTSARALAGAQARVSLVRIIALSHSSCMTVSAWLLRARYVYSLFQRPRRHTSARRLAHLRASSAVATTNGRGSLTQWMITCRTFISTDKVCSSLHIMLFIQCNECFPVEHGQRAVHMTIGSLSERFL